MKPPLHFHDSAFLQHLLQSATRDELIAWLVWNDPNGIYTDADSRTEDLLPLTLLQARQILRAQIERDRAN